ncbi:signal peptidase I [Candidatus Nomurabacteria bacterium RIFCSPLOWO2_02_FULL_44_12]|uniref:Signal peptidase I n=1 Tax=Candidatus Nomurabacteria bacterium RIFCSPLOWO2_12_FULL_44_11 TaxID=1801796 RepID=A0A1F6Y3J4_9BACT|nr:MAG: signal peptidase I [Candidatus Nomurabacteria bacterium RIFCSPHIGHO2_12_FULL_44_22b]OGJ00961.1 MAG: signal peptidase I [Candidatus Nomurabacteria bacterium RIFCSPLOWO2_12_FULL_44_11]OGJ08254.1 MAG: signal peptidase I [Candidatus Nomurabacteria bacterium RIFCSPLOWO2_02_FULL_44_12]
MEIEKEKSGWELVRFAIIALLVVVPIRLFIAQPFVVSGASMFPTFEDKDYLIVDELTYKFNEPKRDDVIIFRYPNDTKKFFIKRIIGLPNETGDIKGGTITITNESHPDGLTLEEPYVKNGSADNVHFELKNGEYYVMGDNRIASSDSRSWGTVSRKHIVGRALVRLWPISDIDFLPGKYEPN